MQHNILKHILDKNIFMENAQLNNHWKLTNGQIRILYSDLIIRHSNTLLHDHGTKQRIEVHIL